MTAKEALWIIKVQLQQNEQNKEAIKVLEGIFDLPRQHIDDEPKSMFDAYVRGHIKALQGIKQAWQVDDEPKGCANYALAEEDENE